MANGREDGKRVALRGDRGDVVTPVDDLGATIQVRDHEADDFALELVGKLVRLRGVRIDREHFLTAELRRRGVAEDVIARAIADRPAAAGISPETLEVIARQSIAFETKKSTALAFTAGLLGASPSSEPSQPTLPDTTFTRFGRFPQKTPVVRLTVGATGSVNRRSASSQYARETWSVPKVGMPA